LGATKKQSAIAFKKTPKAAEAGYEILPTSEDFLCIMIVYLNAGLISAVF